MSKVEVLFGAADTSTVYVKGKAVGVVDRIMGSWRVSARGWTSYPYSTRAQAVRALVREMSE